MEIGDCVLLLGGHTGPLTNVAAAADGSVLITTSSDGTARVWELEKGECLHVLIGHTAAVGIQLPAPDLLELAPLGRAVVCFMGCLSRPCMQQWLGGAYCALPVLQAMAPLHHCNVQY